MKTELDELLYWINTELETNDVAEVVSQIESVIANRKPFVGKNTFHTALGNVVNKQVKEITEPDADEGFILNYEDGSKLEVGFSSCEGWVRIFADNTIKVYGK